LQVLDVPGTLEEHQDGVHARDTFVGEVNVAVRAAAYDEDGPVSVRQGQGRVKPCQVDELRHASSPTSRWRGDWVRGNVRDELAQAALVPRAEREIDASDEGVLRQAAVDDGVPK
jgi:hypothetical protein